MKKTILFLFIATTMVYCGRPDTSSESKEAESSISSPSDYDPNRGLGKYDDLEMAATIDHTLATLGEKISSSKCRSCHKMTDERLVGPGWAGVTERRTAAWLMNFITDPDPMIDVDPELQSQLELCLVRMPNQNVSEEDGFAILEYMRKNDGVE